MDGDPGLLGLPPRVPDQPEDLNTAFWGCRFNGYEVLHHSLKNAPAATRELSEFIREVSIAHDNFAKVLCRLGKQEKSNSPHILISPIWKIVKAFVEKTGAAHVELSKKLFDLSSEIRSYADKDLKERHRPHKKQFHATAESTDKMQHAAHVLAKARDTRQRLENSSSSGPKHENRLKKSSDDVRKSVEQFNTQLGVYEPQMVETTALFSTLEASHVDKLSVFLKSIQSAHESCNVMNSSINEAFEKGIADDASSDYVISQFAKFRGTGNQRPKLEKIDAPANLDTSSTTKLTKKSSLSPSHKRLHHKSPKSLHHHSSRESVNDQASTSTGSIPEQQMTNDEKEAPHRKQPPPVPQLKATNLSALKAKMKAAADDSDSDEDDSEEENKLKIRKSLNSEETKPKHEKSKTESKEEVDSEGYTIRKQPERKQSTASSSGWSSDDDGKPDTYKIKVNIRPAEEAAPISTEQELVKLAAPNLSAPVRNKPRPGRPSTSTTTMLAPPTASSSMVIGDTSLADITLDMSSRETTRETHEDLPPTNQSTPLPKITSKAAPPPPPPPIMVPATVTPPTPTSDTPPTELLELKMPDNFKRPISPLVTGEPRPMTPLITGGSLMGEITWSNTQSGHRPGPGSAPIASVESLSPTSSSDSPYSGVDIPIRVAITETLNAKFIGAGEENTKLATNAEIYIDFGVASIRFLNENHQLLLKIIGSTESVRVNPTFSTLEGDASTIRFTAAALKKSLTKMADEKPGKSQLMLKVASYRVKDKPSSLPLLLLSYWRKEEDGYRVQVVARASINIAQLRLLSKASFTTCECDELTHHVDDKGLLSFNVGDIAAGTERKLSIFLRECTAPTAIAAQFRDIDDRSSTTVEALAASNFKISYLRRRLKTGVFISEPIL